MSHNIANTSTSTSAPTARLPTVEEIHGWKRDRVKGFFQEQKDSLDLDDTEIDTIYNNKVDGNTFLELTRDDLLHIGIALKPAKEIVKLISQIRGEQPVADDFSSLKRDIAHVVKDEVNREIKKVRYLLEGSVSSPGYSMFSDIGDMAQKGPDIDFPLNLTDIIKANSPGKFSKPPINSGVTEIEVQRYFISECQTLENFGALNNQLIVQDTHASPLLGTRKPDFVFIKKGSTLDPLNVVVVGEIKMRAGEKFNNAQVGQAISFGEKVLQLQPRRNFVYVVLTDCIIINIFTVRRKDSYVNYSTEKITGYKYGRVKSEYLAYTKGSENKGWRYLVTIMESSPNLLGWVEPSLKFGNNTVELVRSIGIGRTSVVYEGTFNEKSVVVKMAKKAEYFSCLKNEKSVLQNLSALESPHIPEIILYNNNTLVMTPLGAKIHNLQREDIRDIIKVLELVHSLNYVHRDLRKYNFIRDDNGKIVIIDWGYCIKTDIECDNSTFAGALECMPDEVLKSIITEGEIAYGPKVDLVCLVRSFYLMLHRPQLNRAPFDKDDNIKTRAQSILNFWKIMQSDVWNSIYIAIDNLDYNQLIQNLERLFH